MPVSFRPMRAEDKELFTNLLRSLPSKDNYYLLVDVQNDRTIQRWMEGVEFGEIISVVALEGGQMVGYCNLRINDPPWTRHVGEIRMSVSAAYRGEGIGRILAGKIFAIARARGMQKTLGSDGGQPGGGTGCVPKSGIPYRGSPVRLCEEREWLDRDLS